MNRPARSSAYRKSPDKASRLQKTSAYPTRPALAVQLIEPIETGEPFDKLPPGDPAKPRSPGGRAGGQTLLAWGRTSKPNCCRGSGAKRTQSELINVARLAPALGKATKRDGRRRPGTVKLRWEKRGPWTLNRRNDRPPQWFSSPKVSIRSKVRAPQKCSAGPVPVMAADLGMIWIHGSQKASQLNIACASSVGVGMNLDR